MTQTVTRKDELASLSTDRLVQYVLDLEDERRRYREYLTEKNREIEELKSAANVNLRNNYDRLARLSESVTECCYEQAHVLHAKSTGPMSAEVTLEASISAGDLMTLTPGSSVVLSGASVCDFSDLENYYLHEEWS